MELTLESGRVVGDATESDILTLIDGEEFAILGIDPQTYIQCAEPRGSEAGHVLEYEEGSLDAHYRATDAPIALSRVIGVFVKYLRRDPSWLSDFQWEKMDV